MDASMPYGKNKEIFVDPLRDEWKEGEFGFALFRPLGDRQTESVANPAEVPLTFLSKELGWNATGTLELIDYRWKGRSVVSFLDGHARIVKPDWPTGPVTLVIERQEEE